jgi:hypothetical protein
MPTFLVNIAAACRTVWRGADPCPMWHDPLPPGEFRHVCRGHVVETGDCLCACGARHNGHTPVERSAS